MVLKSKKAGKKRRTDSESELFVNPRRANSHSNSPRNSKISTPLPRTGELFRLYVHLSKFELLTKMPLTKTSNPPLTLPATKPIAQPSDQPFILPSHPNAPQFLRFLLLTLPMLGVSILNSTVQGYASPYLLSLGLSKAALSGVLLAGPISGLIVQPLVGAASDNCRLAWGRRRPYIVGGIVFAAVSTLLLGWIGQLIKAISGEEMKVATLWISIICIFVMDFAINALSAIDRALFIDLLRADLQETGNAWASRMAALGSICGYGLGWGDLVALTGGFLGGTQLEVLVILVTFLMLVTHFAMIFAVTETRLPKDHPPTKFWAMVKEFPESWKSLPQPGKNTCWVDAFSFGGWCPLLSFATTWVGNIYTEVNPGADATTATRMGSLAMTLQSSLTLVCVIVLPLLVAPSPQQALTSSRWHQKWLSLPLLWTISNFIFVVLMLSSWWASDSVAGGIVVVTLLGLPWAVTTWVPFAIIGDVVESQKTDGSLAVLRSRSTEGNDYNHELSSDEDSISDSESEQHASGDREADKTGVILGLHNCFVVIPQLISFGVSSLTFSLLDPKTPPNSLSGRAWLPSVPLSRRDFLTVVQSWNSFDVVFSIGALSTLVAATISLVWTLHSKSTRSASGEQKALRRAELSSFGVGEVWPHLSKRHR